MPFTVSDFLNVFKNYNLTVYPFQIILFLSAIFTIYISVRKKVYSDKLITSILVFYWIWIGFVYHILFFSVINPAAYIFGIIFILQGFLFFKSGILDKRLQFEFSNNLKSMIGALFLIYALIIYPVLGYFDGRIYPESPTFGLPCPTVIFTFGILLWAKNKVPLYLVIIPFIWSIIGISAAVNLGIKEDFGLVIAGLLCCGFIISQNIKSRKMKHVKIS